MSINRNYYVIAGYDVTTAVTDKYKDWQWTDDGEKYFCNQSNGRIQFFNDPMSGSYLYFGYIIASGDEYEFETTVFNPWKITNLKTVVDLEFDKLVEYGVMDEDKAKYIPFRLIAFEECS